MTQEQYAKYKRLNDRLAELNDLNGNIGRLRFYLNENTKGEGQVETAMRSQLEAEEKYRSVLECRISKGWY